MLQTYLEGEAERRTASSFLTMAEAGELGHWEIVQTMSKTVGEDDVAQLADWAVEIQREHFDGVRDSSVNSLRRRRAPTSNGGDLEIGFDGGVVAQALVTPGVVVEATDGA
jgi:hypothetical protein